MENNYTGMTLYEGLLGLRNERAMYLGSALVLSPKHAPIALVQTMQEVVSNSIDEFLVGACTEITVTIHNDNAVTIQDNGRGMPKGPDHSFEDVINSLTKPHASGKFEGNSYAAMGTAGMHGIGLKATNATSRYMKLHALSHATTLNKKGEKVLSGGYVEYEVLLNLETVVESKVLRTWSKNDIERVSLNTFIDKNTGKTLQTGTTITYLPDDGPVSEIDQQPVFGSINWINDDLYPRFEAAAFLNAGLKINFIDERQESQDDSSESKYLAKSWKFDNGLSEYVASISEGQTLLSKFKKPISFKEDVTYEDKPFQVQSSLIITDDTYTNIVTYANGVPTKDGGPHYDGFKTAIVKAINDYAKDKGLNKTNKSKRATAVTFKEREILEGITGILEVKLPSDISSFTGQTKEKLATVQAQPVVYEVVYTNISNWLYDNEKAAEQIITKIIESKTAMDAAYNARQEAKSARQQKTKGISKISGKLKPASSNDPKKKELFIVEGDSASNVPRNKRYQAVLPLRGKTLNVQNVSLTDAMANLEFSSMVNVIGAGVGPTFNIEDAKFNKIIIMADADSDGAHICSLVLTGLYKYCRPLFDAGYVYVAVTPLYRAVKYVKGKAEYKLFYTEAEMNENRQKLAEDGKYTIQRFKGLGEMQADMLEMTGTNPETRRLIRVSVDDAAKTTRIMETLMGKSPAHRKEWAAESIDYDKLYEMI